MKRGRPAPLPNPLPAYRERESWRSVCILLASLLLLGCAGKTVLVRVIDGESGKPLEGVVVHADYRCIFLGDVVPPDTSGNTDRNGSVKLHVWKSKTFRGLTVTDPQNRYCFARSQSEQAPPINLTDLPPDEMWFDAFLLPKPTITLVLPDGYHGPLQFHHEKPSPLEPKAGERDFMFDVQPPDVFLSGKGVLGVGAQLRYRYASGQQLPQFGNVMEERANPDAVGIRMLSPVNGSPPLHRVFVGTAEQRRQFP